MASNVQCPVCTLFLLPGMDLSDHLETHPKEQVIKALVQLSLKSEVSETESPDNPKKANKCDERMTPMSEASECESNSASETLGMQEKRSDSEESTGHAPLHQDLGNRQSGYLFENNNGSSSGNSNNYLGPPNPYYHYENHQQHQQQQLPPPPMPQQQHHHLHHHNHLQQNYNPYNSHPHGGTNSSIGQQSSQPPMRLFSYQQPPKPLQPPPAYGAAISQIRSQNSQNLMVNNVNRPPFTPGNFTPTSSSSASSSSLSATPSRLPPPLPPPPLNQQHQSSFSQVGALFNEPCDNNAMSPRRSSATPPMRPPPQLYRSPMSSNGQYSRQSNSPYAVMTGSPSVLRFAESPVTAQYLERENGDFIVQETPKHVVECVEKDDGEFSVIERVYHMPPSVVQINEDHDDNLSDHGSNCDDMKMSADDDGSNSAWTVEGSSEQSEATEQREQKKSGITVLSDVQLDINEYLDLMGNIIASGKVAKTRTEIIKIEKFEVDEEVKEETAGDMCFNEELEDGVLLDNDQKFDESTEECQQNNDSSPVCVPVTAPSIPVMPGTTSVIRLAANTSARSNSPSFAPKVEETAQSQGTEEFESKANITDDQQKIEEQEQTTSSAIIADEPEGAGASTSEFVMKNEEGNTDSNTLTTTALVSKAEVTIAESSPSDSQNHTDQGNPIEPENQEKQIKKENNQPICTYQQSIKRPIKKVPKKLIIKPKSKPAGAPTPTQVPTPVASTSTEIVSLDNQKEEVISEADEDQKSVKSEKIAFTIAESVPPPLFAAADEKLPPDDDVMPSTSSGRDNTQSDQQLEENKSPAVLAAFLDQCMKKEEEVEDHPMHSIFGMDIESTAQTIDDGLTPQPTSEFPSASLFAKPLTTSEHLALSESALPDSSELQHQDQNQPQPQQSTTSYVEYPFSFLYSTEANQQEEHKHDISPPMYCNEDFNKYSASTSGGNSASCTWYQSQSSENDFEIDGKGSYLDLDSCKRSTSFAAATEGSLPTTEEDALNIRTDEKMPAKGEISGQESNCGLENSWSQPLYSEFPARFPNPYQNFMSTHESWSHDHYFRPQDLSSSVETKNFGLRLTEESPVTDALPSTSKRKAKPAAKVIRKKSFQCAHCNTHFPLLKEKNAHLIKQHGYKRVNRRLIRDPPTSTVTTATMNTIDAGASLLLGLDACALLPPPALPEEEDSKAAIVKIEQENQEQKDSKKSLTSLALSLAAAATTTSTTLSRTKYDSMRARDNRMLINFNLNALSVKNESDAQQYYAESKSSFFCFVCRRDFVTVKLFDEHLAEHPAECFTCHKKFTRWKNFMVHLKRHLGWKDFACTYCEKKFVIRSALVEHMRMHTGHTPLKCKICGKSFKRYSNLTQHRKRHGIKINRNKEYVCYCGEVLPSKARFIWHKETHDLKPKCCPYCRDRFVHANSLRRHIRLAHSDKFDYTEPMECPMCKQIYAKSSIKAHMATHSMDTQHECLICNKSFSTKWNLKIHNWVHANRTTKPFKCDQCVKAFVREVDYNNHMNSHKQIKPYTCEHCGCKFIRKYNYIRHRREHHGNKKFTCDLCGKLFHRHYYLIEHRRIHTGERPFQCTICGKSSTTKTNHNKHLKIHHSRDPFTSEA